MFIPTDGQLWDRCRKNICKGPASELQDTEAGNWSSWYPELGSMSWETRSKGAVNISLSPFHSSNSLLCGKEHCSRMARVESSEVQGPGWESHVCV